MPRKKKIEDPLENQALGASALKEEAKPKKKIAAAKRKLESAGAVSSAGLKAEALSLESADLSPNTFEMDPEITTEPIEDSAQPAASKSKVNFNDIRPKSASNDASFLAPEKFTFDLKKQKPIAQAEQRAKSKWTKALIYFLSAIVILMVAALIVLTFYSAKVLNEPTLTSGNVAVPTNSNASPGSAATGTTAKLSAGLANVSEPAKTLILSALQSSYAVNAAQDPAPVPVTAVDTLYLKSSAQSKSQDLLNLLLPLGLKPQIQAKEDIKNDFVLYLASTVQKPDLTGLTASVYNATGASGAAKKYCAILTSFKVSSCSALNSAARQSGLSISAKSPAAIINLSRTSQFQSAKFSDPAKSQVEDIRVTVGK